MDAFLAGQETRAGLACLMRLAARSKRAAWRAAAWARLPHPLCGLPEGTGAAEAAEQLNGEAAFVPRWHALGPFLVGKAELDGDPAHDATAVSAADLARGGGPAYDSELVRGGTVRWARLEAERSGPAELAARVAFPAVRWGLLVQSLSSVEVMEFRAWLRAELVVTSAGPHRLACAGVSVFFLRGPGGGRARTLTGDVYGRGDVAPVVRLGPGTHEIWLRPRGKGAAGATVRCSAARVPDGAPPATLLPPRGGPDVLLGRLASPWLALPLRSESAEPLELRGVSAETPGGSLDFHVAVELAHRGVVLAPGQLAHVPVRVELAGGGAPPCPLEFDVVASLAEAAPAAVPRVRRTAAARVRLRCRDPAAQSWSFTHLDRDGSVARAAAVAPLGAARGGARPAPAVLALHGTGVSPEDMADAFKRRRGDGEMEFGVRGAWVVAPSRFGAHNWESVGYWSALSALEALGGELDVPGVAAPLASAAVVAGHSMGGHGAWHVAAHRPDLASCVAPLAGWARKEAYGDSNRLFVFDAGASAADPRLKAAFESAVADGYADLLAPINLAHAPVLARVGAEDRAVPAFHSRRMVRLLHARGAADARLVEVAAKEHWWWDSSSSNDGGTMNDEQMREFYASCVAGERSASAACGASGFVLAAVDPGTTGTRCGARIAQQLRPLELSTLEFRPPSAVVTRNVARFLLPAALLAGGPLTVNGVPVEGRAGGEDGLLHVCGTALCNSTSVPAGERCPESGAHAARAVHERPFAVLYSERDGEAARDAAVHLANLHAAAHETFAPVFSDAQVSGTAAAAALVAGRNLVIVAVGGLDQDFAAMLAPWSPVEVLDGLGGFRVAWDGGGGGADAFVAGGPGVGAVFLAPLRDVGGGADGDGGGDVLTAGHGRRVALVVAGTDADGLGRAVAAGEPTVPPMVRAPYGNQTPDVLVLGPRVDRDGVAGVLAAGSWDRRWRAQRANVVTTE